MTPGQQALAEAARLEAARVYGRTQRQHDLERTVPAISVDEYDAIIDERRAAIVAGRTVIPFERPRAAVS